MATSEVKDNPGAGQFEVTVDDEVAVARYALRPRRIEFTHTFVPDDLRGRGIATRLVEAALASARERQLKVTPTCAMFAAYMKRHAETHDLLDDAARSDLA